MGYAEGGNWQQRLALAGQLPVDRQFFSMEIIRLQEELDGAMRETTSGETAAQLHFYLELAVVSVEVRWRVIPLVHRHDDAVKRLTSGMGVPLWSGVL